MSMHTDPSVERSRSVKSARPVTLDDIAFPHPKLRLEQDDEWIVVRSGGQWQRIRLHDYNEVFSIPGLYDLWVYGVLECASPRRVRDLLRRTLADAKVDPGSLTVLDLGAGPGSVAKELSTIGIGTFVGVDIAPMARVAAERDHPECYVNYVVDDLTAMSDESKATLARHSFNAMTCVAALGFGDIPTAVFSAAIDQLEPGAWVAFTIKNEFVENPDASPFATLVDRSDASGDLRILARETYVHRLDSSGEPILYTGFIARTRE